MGGKYGRAMLAAFVEDRVTGCTYGFGDSSAIFPLASNLNYERGDVIPNLTAVAVANDGRFRLYSGSGGTHLLFDLAGWFAR